MKSVRIVRMVIAAVFLLATVAYFLTGASFNHTNLTMLRFHDQLEFVERAQVIPSSIALCMGALLFWLCATFFVGRIYCSTVCPVGTFSDVFMRLRKELGKIFPKKLRLQFRWKDSKVWRYHIMAAYYICLVIGLVAVAFVLEPWNIVRDASSAIDPDAVATTWSVLGAGMVVGIAVGFAMLVIVAVWGFIAGRDYCNLICPLGQTMALMDKYCLLHIEFDPDRCISCMRCEEICRSSCIQVKTRRVDNSRCVKCFDCVASCPVSAIRLQGTRNRAATPMMERSD